MVSGPREPKVLAGTMGFVVLFSRLNVSVFEESLDFCPLEFVVHLFADFHSEIVMPLRALHDVWFEW